MTQTMKKFTDLSPANNHQALDRKSPVTKSDYYTVKTASGFNAATTDIVRVPSKISA